MKTYIVLFSIFLIFINSFCINAQTTLSAGDIAFVAVNSDATGIGGATAEADTFAFIALTNISANTIIGFSDGNYTDANGYLQLNSANSDWVLFWQCGTALSTGDIVKIWAGPNTCTSCPSGTSNGTILSGKGLSLTIAGDQIFAFQGVTSIDTTTNYRVTPTTFIAGIHYNYISGTTGTSNWDGGATPGTATSELPNSLTNGTNAVWVYASGPTENDNFRIKCSALSGSAAAIRAACNDVANWDVRDDSAWYPAVPVCTPTSTTWNGTTWSSGAPTSTIDAIIASSTTPGTFTCKNLTINSGVALTMSGGTTATINGNVTNSGNGFSGTGTFTFASSGALSGNVISTEGVITVSTGATLTTNSLLTLASNATNTGRIGNSGGSISGNVTIQRYIPGKRAFRFFGHPFTTAQALTALTDDIDITGSGGATNGFTATATNNPSAFYWNPVTADNTTAGNNPGWVAFTHTNGTSPNGWDQYELIRVLVRGTPGQGISGGSYTPSAVTLDMAGAVNQGTQVVTLTKGSSSSFVACGNPFPCGVQLNAVARGANIGANYYVWDATSGTAGAYVTNAFTTSYVLPAFAALITTASANSSNTLTFEEADKATGDASLFKGTANKNWVELLIYDSTIKWDRLLINLDDNAMDVEDKLDAVKLYNPGLDFFTLSKDDIRLAIDVRPYTDGASIPLGLTAYNRHNRYVIKTGNFDIPVGTKLYLHDKYLNKKEELKPGFEYWFDVTSDSLTQGDKRFEINMVGQPANSIASPETQTAKMQLIPNPARKEVKISFNNLNVAGRLRLTNLTGQIIFSREVNATTGSVIIPLHNIPVGVYIAELQGYNTRFTEKLIVE